MLSLRGTMSWPAFIRLYGVGLDAPGETIES